MKTERYGSRGYSPDLRSRLKSDYGSCCTSCHGTHQTPRIPANSSLGKFAVSCRVLESDRAEVQTPNAYLEALEKDIQMAEAGDPAARVRVAVRYERGQEFSQNCFEALGLYRKAADQDTFILQIDILGKVASFQGS